MDDKTISLKDISTYVDRAVATSIKPGTRVDFLQMVGLAKILTDAVADLLTASKATGDEANPDPTPAQRAINALTAIHVVAAILRRCDVEGSIIGRD